MKVIRRIKIKEISRSLIEKSNEFNIATSYCEWFTKKRIFKTGLIIYILIPLYLPT